MFNTVIYILYIYITLFNHIFMICLDGRLTDMSTAVYQWVKPQFKAVVLSLTPDNCLVQYSIFIEAYKIRVKLLFSLFIMQYFYAYIFYLVFGY